MLKALFAFIALSIFPTQTVSAPMRYILFVGDSKVEGVTGIGRQIVGYEPTLLSDLGSGYAECLPRAAHGGSTVRSMATVYAYDFARRFCTPDLILVGLGTNDESDDEPYFYSDHWHATPDVWRAQYAAYIARWHSLYPNARIGITYPNDVYYNFTLMDSQIDQLIAGCAFYCFAGLHEPLLLDAEDTHDRIHYLAEGYQDIGDDWCRTLDSQGIACNAPNR